MKLSRFASLFDISRTTVYNYIDNGILFPHKNENDFFEFTGRDMQSLIVHRRLKQFGLLQEQRVNLMNNDSKESHISCLKEVKDKMAAQLRYDEQKLLYMQNRIQQTDFACANIGHYWIHTHCAAYCFPYTSLNWLESIDFTVETHVFKKCMKYAELTECELITLDNDSKLQFTIDKKHVDDLALSLERSGSLREEVKSLSTSVIIDNFDGLGDVYKRLRDYAEQMHLSISDHLCFLVRPLLFLSAKDDTALCQISLLLRE